MRWNFAFLNHSWHEQDSDCLVCSQKKFRASQPAGVGGNVTKEVTLQRAWCFQGMLVNDNLKELDRKKAAEVTGQIKTDKASSFSCLTCKTTDSFHTYCLRNKEAGDR